jgi:hypothetical protein
MWVQGALGAALFALAGTLFFDSSVAVQAASIGAAKALLFIVLSFPSLVIYARTLARIHFQDVIKATLPAALCAMFVYLLGVLLQHAISSTGMNATAQAIVVLVPLGLVSLAGVITLSPAARRAMMQAARRYSPSVVGRVAARQSRTAAKYEQI